MPIRRTASPDADGRELIPADGAALLRDPEELANPVLRLILERARRASTPADRDDGNLVCLAVEGGGMRAAVTVGMCVALEAAGLTGAFDRVYGVSAGALNSWGFAAGQAAIGSTHYLDAIKRGVVRRTAPLRGRPMVNLEVLFDELIATQKPLSFPRAGVGPELRVLATSLETMTLRVLRGFEDVEELMRAVHASAALPLLGGDPPTFRGERMVDGSLIEPIPFATALREGATHVLVLRSRPEGYRKPYYIEVGETFAVRDDPGLAALLRARQGTYNRQASQLERAWSHPGGGARLTQIAVPRTTRLVGRLEPNADRLARAIDHGARAVASALFTEQVDLHWQPVLYRSRR